MVPIITYHGVGPDGLPLFMPVPLFEQQIQQLSDCGYQSVSIRALLRWLDGEGELPERAVVLTFDDAYLSVYTEALPVLERYAFSASLFVVTGYCGLDNQWRGQSPTVPRSPIMSWDQIRDLSGRGWELGSHTHTHPPLTELPIESVEEELRRSRKALIAATSESVEIFAQPYGASNEMVDRMVRAEYRVAVGTRLGLVDKGADRFRLPRIDAFYLDPRLIPHLQRNWFRHYLHLRQTIRWGRRLAQKDWHNFP
jgi:peptidoglycan/xylan/chitin deacetylase (PgdA/CDA1 family)